MAHCKYCNEQDESRLIMSSRLVNGRVETIDICFRCYWRERFEAEGDGESLREGELQHEEEICGDREGSIKKSGTFLFP
jgi:hypothetical protein